MVEFKQITPLLHLDLQSGKATSGAEVVLSDRRGLAIAQVFAKKGKTAAVAKKLGISDRPRVATIHKNYTALPLSPGQWMLFANEGADGAFKRLLDDQIAKIGYVSEQSHSRAVIRISGSKAVEVLSRECRLDLHPGVAEVGFCAQTNMAKIGVLMHKVDDNPTFDLVVFSGFADSFWHWITHASAEFGFEGFADLKHTAFKRTQPTRHPQLP
jgi:methylglutamate dehydrogenase subunit D